jgi:AraC family transcriptional activator of pobA
LQNLVIYCRFLVAETAGAGRHRCNLSICRLITMRVERIEPGLHARSWSFNRHGEAARQFVLVSDGAGEAEAGDDRFAIAAPALLWLGSARPGRLRLDAGTTGFRGWVSDRTILSAVGDQPESVGLRYLADRGFVLSLSGAREQATVIERCLNATITELAQPQAGSDLMQSALMRVMLVAMLRISGVEEVATPGSGERAGLLQRFRQLVEMNFRAHWTVAQYAGALGISPDRLHAVCTSGIGKSPKALISERLAHEAAQRLERSSLTIQQLGHSLGFNDAAHFSSFFSRMIGVPPGRYRKAAARSRLEGLNAPTPSFADWP